MKSVVQNIIDLTFELVVGKIKLLEFGRFLSLSFFYLHKFVQSDFNVLSDEIKLLNV